MTTPAELAVLLPEEVKIEVYDDELLLITHEFHGREYRFVVTAHMSRFWIAAAWRKWWERKLMQIRQSESA